MGGYEAAGGDYLEDGQETLGQWERIENGVGDFPCPRSNSACVVFEDNLYVFGGFTYFGRLNEIYQFHFPSQRWTKIETRGFKPSPRENNGAMLLDSKMYIFGGYSGTSWLNDFLALDLHTFEWENIPVQSKVPTGRFGFASGVIGECFYIFGGFDGSNWLNDCFEISLDGDYAISEQITLKGEVPSARSCPSHSVHNKSMYIFGGFDGINRLNDFYKFNPLKRISCKIVCSLNLPSPRYFHISALYDDKLFIFGGYNGNNRLNDLYQFNLQSKDWQKLEFNSSPSGRSSMVSFIHQEDLYIFGGYNGTNVMNDFYKVKLSSKMPVSSFTSDLLGLLNNRDFSDVTFLVEGQEIYANKAILATRSEHFQALLFSGMKESKNNPVISVKNVSCESFHDILQYIYSDQLPDNPTSERLIHLLYAADLFLIDRLKYLCQISLINSIKIDNCIELLIFSNKFRGNHLKNSCMNFVLINLEDVKKQKDFQKLLKEPELLMEILIKTN